MSTKSKSKDKRAGKEQKASSKASAIVSATSGIPTSAYNPVLGTFHTLEPSPTSLAPSLHVNGRFKNIDESDDHSGSTNGSGGEYDSASNNDSRSVESEEQKDKIQNTPPKQEVVPGADNEKREKIRQKNERKHLRQKEKRAQELHERCGSYLKSRKLEALAQQLVGMGFSVERATMALLQNEGKVENAVLWLLERVEEADKRTDPSLDSCGNVKIDISQELAKIVEMELRFKCSKQDVERAVVACEGDLDKAEETLRLHKQDSPPLMQKLEEASDLPSLSNGNISLTLNQNLVRPLPKSSSNNVLQQRRDEKDSNYAKAAVKVAPAQISVSKNVQPLVRTPQQKLDWARPPLVTATTEKRWPVGVSSPSVSYPLASPLQVSNTLAKVESNYVPVTGEVKPGIMREPVVVMQRPQSVNAKQAPVSNIGLSPPGTTGGWYPSSSESLKPNGLLQHIPSTRSPSPNNLSSNHFYHQPIYPQAQQLIPGSGSLDVPVTTRGNSWGITGTSPPLAAASLGLFSGNGSSCYSDWSTGGAMLSCDYNNVDWSLDPRALPHKPNGLMNGMGSFQKSKPQIYESNQLAMGVKPGMRLLSSNGNSLSLNANGLSMNGNGLSLMGLHDGVDATVDTVPANSREWTSPFEEKDLFSIPRQFVSSPSL
ncbi:hypothetical protein Drorol1_Dr00001671 [Drosera rotundifolia]